MFDEVNYKYIYLFFCPSPSTYTMYIHLFLCVQFLLIIFSTQFGNFFHASFGANFIFSQFRHFFTHFFMCMCIFCKIIILFSKPDERGIPQKLSIMVDVNLGILNILLLSSFKLKFKFNSSVKTAMRRGCC